MADLVRTWVHGQREAQHLAEAPSSDTAREWDGTTACGIDARLVWVPYERVDARQSCPRCAATHGIHPVLEGDHPGPA